MIRNNFQQIHVAIWFIVTAFMNNYQTHILGYPRIGAQRELKWALEKFWRGEIDASQLEQQGRELRKTHWREQADAGLDFVSVGDFSFYDQVLDTACQFGIVPARYGVNSADLSLTEYFTLARGNQQYAPLAMTKWLDTNYHYLVPELSDDCEFKLNASRLLAEIKEALNESHCVKPVILGPVTLLSLCQLEGKSTSTPLSRLNELLPIYVELLENIQRLGVSWVQIDEPIFCTDLAPDQQLALSRAYENLSGVEGINILLATYFGEVRNHLNLLLTLPVAGIHIDASQCDEDAIRAAKYLGSQKVLSLGIVDGRNVWLNDLQVSHQLVEKIRHHVDDSQIWLASSCSLQYVPHTVANESKLEPQLRSWLSFARQKLDEIVQLAQPLESLLPAIEANQLVLAEKLLTAGVIDSAVRERLAEELPNIDRNRTSYQQRKHKQQAALQLPLLPSTTIGSFPQTKEIRKARAQYLSGQISAADYQQFLQAETRECIRKQEEAGIDVLVHGEFERNDMVEYFASQLAGFASTSAGWVQSYGSRCTKPPLIWGDVSRLQSMTLDWVKFAQSITNKPVKGMLTGTTTILQWSFLRNDIPRRHVSQQIALALRDEVLELEANGVQIIQVDEAALREGLPLRTDKQADYLDESVDSFLITTSGVREETQIHTHMCYSQFNAIYESIIALDADVISIEATRNQMKLLDVFSQSAYPNQIGPGVWDIHSPRVPSVAEIKALIKKALYYIPAEQLWINPDCGLKTRGWLETEASMKNLVSACREIRAELCESAITH